MAGWRAAFIIACPGNASLMKRCLSRALNRVGGCAALWIYGGRMFQAEAMADCKDSESGVDSTWERVQGIMSLGHTELEGGEW